MPLPIIITLKINKRTLQFSFHFQVFMKSTFFVFGFLKDFLLKGMLIL